jgi:hypothetical protein
VLVEQVTRFLHHLSDGDVSGIDLFDQPLLIGLEQRTATGKRPAA